MEAALLLSLSSILEFDVYYSIRIQVNLSYHYIKLQTDGQRLLLLKLRSEPQDKKYMDSGLDRNSIQRNYGELDNKT